MKKIILGMLVVAIVMSVQTMNAQEAPKGPHKGMKMTPEKMAEIISCLAGRGLLNIVGGCCGTSPEFIRELKALTDKVTQERIEYRPVSAVCSGSKLVEITEPRVIGERINPTGKKLFKEALRNGDINYILKQAVEQVSAGADILDIDVGLPDIYEKEMMIRIVKAVQSVTDVPLQLDSTDPEVLEAGLRVYNGKAIINSVNAEEKSLSTILPLVKKYGACV